MSITDDGEKIEETKDATKEKSELKKPTKRNSSRRANTSPKQSIDSRQQPNKANISPGQYGNLLKSISKNTERQSKEIGNLHIQVTHLQKQLATIDRNLQDTRKFIENRGWKKKNRKK